MRHLVCSLLVAGLLASGAGAIASRAQNGPASTVRLPIVFSAGHDTDPRDGGRPVVLVAGALQVPPQVFRNAFSHVHPAPAGQAPEPGQVRLNKEALMNALASYGVTNERLDAVSNRYRYVRSRGEMWPTRPAVAFGTAMGGTVTGFVVTDSGYGYSSAPQISVPGFPLIHAEARLAFGPDFSKNGSVMEVVLIQP